MILGFEVTPAKNEPTVEDLVLVVGVLSGTGLHPGNSKRKKPAANPPTIAQVAAWNEFGTEHSDPDSAFASGTSTKMPARPFMRSVLTAPGAKEDVSELFAMAVRAINRGDADTETAAGVIGTKLVSNVQQSMDKWGVVDTGLTERSISWEMVS